MKLTAQQTKILTTIALLVVGGFIVSIVVAKAALVGFTHDESFTYLNFVHASFMDIVSLKQWYSNNHLLNTLAMKYSELAFGSSELALRLPNILLLVVYFSYAVALFWRSNKLLLISTLILMTANPWLLDYFGLARGYGMSIGFSIMGLYHCISWYRSARPVHLYLFHLAYLLAVLSNFVLLPLYVAVLLLHNLIAYALARTSDSREYHWWRSNKAHLLPLIVNFIVLYEPVRRVVTHNKLGFGGSNGFIADTGVDVISAMLFFVPPGWPRYVGLAITALLLAAGLSISFRKWRERNQHFFDRHLGLALTSGLIVLFSLILIAMHHLLGTDYPVARFSRFIVPLVMVQAAFMADFLMHKGYRAPVLVLGLLASCALYSTVRDLQFNWTAEWAYDAKTPEMLHILETAHQENPNTAQIELGVHGLFAPTINFYRQTQHLDWLANVNRGDFSETDDYRYVWHPEPVQPALDGYQLVRKFPLANASLYRRLDAASSAMSRDH